MTQEKIEQIVVHHINCHLKMALEQQCRRESHAVGRAEGFRELDNQGYQKNVCDNTNA